MRGIVKYRVAHPGHVEAVSPVGMHEIPFSVHLPEIFAALIHRGPDRNNRFYAHILQFFYHGIRVGPVSFFKFEISLHGPVEKIHHNGIHGESASFMLSGNRKDFLLGTVS